MGDHLESSGKNCNCLIKIENNVNNLKYVTINPSEEALHQTCNCPVCACSKLLKSKNWLQYFPISYFTIPLGIASYSGTWMGLLMSPHIPATTATILQLIPDGLFWLSFSILVVFCALYALKFAFYRSEVSEEYNCTKASNFFFMPLLISLLLCLVTPADYRNNLLLQFLFTGFFAMTTILCIITYGQWMSPESTKSLANATPVYLLAIMPWFFLSIFATSLHFEELSIICFAIGMLVSCIGYSSMLPNMINSPVSERKNLVLLIIVAPISQAAKALAEIGMNSSGNSLHLIAKMLIYADLFVFLMILRMGLDFFPSKAEHLSYFWAVVFPTNSVTIVLLHFAKVDDNLTLWIISCLMVTVSSCSLAFAVTRTLYTGYKCLYVNSCLNRMSNSELR